MIAQIKLFGIGFVIWWFILFPFEFKWVGTLFTPLRKSIQFLILQLDSGLHFESDSLGTLLILPIVFLLSGLTLPLVRLGLKRFSFSADEILKTLLIGVITIFLFNYGWNKITKEQFYLPESSILHTTFGQLSKDIAFWSLMGSSYFLVVSIGILELTIAILLLFKRTVFVGTFLAVLLFSGIVMLNFAFDISVKQLSIYLLFFSLSLLFLQFKRLQLLFIHSTQTFVVPQNKKGVPIFCWIILLLFVLDPVSQTLKSKNWNDDKQLRLVHHGAYAILDDKNYSQLFVHRRHYLILKTQQDQFVDYKIVVIDKHKWIIQDEYSKKYYTLTWHKKGQKEFISSTLPELKNVVLIKLLTNNLPLLKSDVHFFSDRYH